MVSQWYGQRRIPLLWQLVFMELLSRPPLRFPGVSGL
jgi:hypothetical protein